MSRKASLGIFAVVVVISLMSWIYSTQAAQAAQRQLASVNGKVITEEEVRASLTPYSEGMKNQLLSDAHSRDQLVNGVINQEVLYGEAVKRGLDKDPKVVMGLENLKRQFLANALVEKEIGSKVTEAAAKAFYERYSNKYSSTMVHAQHILLKTEEEAKNLLPKAKNALEDFNALAEKYSLDPSVKNNRGDLGFFARDRMVPEFAEPVFTAADGEVIGPIRTSYGYHIVKVIERKVGPTLNYDEVELKVKADLRQDLLQSYLVKLKKDAKIQRSANL